jgi:hypothetical protein
MSATNQTTSDGLATPYKDMTLSDLATAMSSAEGWKPEPGDEIDGTVLGIKIGESDYKREAGKDPRYPIVFVRTDDGKTSAVHCFHAVLENEMKAAQPLPGERIFIKCISATAKGAGGRNTAVRYAVAVHRDADNTRSAWDQL